MRKVFLGLLFLSLPVMASEVQVWGRSFNSSCGYYSLTWGDYDITFRDTSLPWGTKVTVDVAFGGYRATGGGNQENFSWDRDRWMAMDSVAPFTWRVRKSETLHSRSSNVFLTQLKFIFKVEAPGRAPQYVNGGSSWGHFVTDAQTYPTPCVGGGAEVPQMRKLPVHVVSHH